MPRATDSTTDRASLASSGRLPPLRSILNRLPRWANSLRGRGAGRTGGGSGVPASERHGTRGWCGGELSHAPLRAPATHALALPSFR